MLDALKKNTSEPDTQTFPGPKMFDRLFAGLGTRELSALGMGRWDGNSEYTHWLYPTEWYGIIPEGHEVVTIGNNKVAFTRERFKDDFGHRQLLPFGFIQNHPTTRPSGEA